LTRHVGLDPRLEIAIDELINHSLLDKNVAEAQKLLTRILVLMRLISPSGAMPGAGPRDLLERACGFENWDELVAAHDRARQCIAELWSQVQEQA
jgi:[glutamine synthetase] adenylyltransferase / [glutamine synthetase]-adenylyl-L-tyrosine phosphorylase